MHGDSLPSLRVLHGLGLSRYGGMERLFSGYLAESESQNKVSHNVLAFDDQIHPLLIQTLKWHAKRVQWLHRWHRLRIPQPFRGLQRHNVHRIARLTGAETMLLWNTLGTRRSRSLSQRIPLIYYDHSLSWYSPGQLEDIIPQFRGAIACSHASARMLALHWEFPGPIKICHNPPCELPVQQAPKRLPTNRRFRIGVVSRLAPSKGINLALHALESLRNRHYDCEMHIAGTGPQEDQLRRLAHHLGVERHVHFHGLLTTMQDFYNSIDFLCHPSLIEPSGLACREASGYGCPVIAANIDGLPEIVETSVNGYLINPTVSLSTFAKELDGSTDDVPPSSYDPERDELRSPAAVDPSQLVEIAAKLLDDPEEYAHMSRAAIAITNKKPSFPSYCRDLDETLINWDTLF